MLRAAAFGGAVGATGTQLALGLDNQWVIVGAWVVLGPACVSLILSMIGVTD